MGAIELDAVSFLLDKYELNVLDVVGSLLKKVESKSVNELGVEIIDEICSRYELTSADLLQVVIDNYNEKVLKSRQALMNEFDRGYSIGYADGYTQATKDSKKNLLELCERTFLNKEG